MSGVLNGPSQSSVNRSDNFYIPHAIVNASLRERVKSKEVRLKTYTHGKYVEISI